MKTTFGIGYLSSIVFKLSFLNRLQAFFVFPCSSVPFLSTTQTGLLYGERDGRIACVYVFTKSDTPIGSSTTSVFFSTSSPIIPSNVVKFGSKKNVVVVLRRFDVILGSPSVY
ncbi:uncharacterized protein LOC108101962 [Drosophila ficusphila]|uniref:uncharacterized protein LOC108101962 n=1 Tax=Drosophila ficusphila TaxID=30025 RepID=UPI0007E6AF32|nr:uncharacterized protein LOC108101962 [Drosophila ficusphila]